MKTFGGMYIQERKWTRPLFHGAITNPAMGDQQRSVHEICDSISFHIFYKKNNEHLSIAHPLYMEIPLMI